MKQCAQGHTASLESACRELQDTREGKGGRETLVCPYSRAFLSSAGRNFYPRPFIGSTGTPLWWGPAQPKTSCTAEPSKGQG